MSARLDTKSSNEQIYVLSALNLGVLALQVAFAISTWKCKCGASFAGLIVFATQIVLICVAEYFVYSAEAPVSMSSTTERVDSKSLATVIDRILIVYIIYALLLAADWMTHLVVAAPCFLASWIIFQLM